MHRFWLFLAILSEKNSNVDMNAYNQVLLDQQKEKKEILLENLVTRREKVYFDLDSQNQCFDSCI